MDAVKELVNEALCKIHEDTELELQLTNLWALGESKVRAKHLICSKLPSGVTRDSILVLIDKIWNKEEA